MKKYLFLPLIGTLALSACTTKEQDQQIRSFWMQQYANVMMKSMAGLKLPGTHPGAFPAQVSRSAQPAAHIQARPQIPQPQMMEVTLDSNALPGKAPEADRVRMKRALDAVQLSNQSAVSDIGTAFGEQVKTKALLITARTERQLKQEASQADSFAAYFASQTRILQTQEQQLTQLMTQNRSNIKKIKNVKKSL